MSRHISYINCSVVLHKSKKNIIKISYSTVVVKNTKRTIIFTAENKTIVLKECGRQFVMDYEFKGIEGLKKFDK